ncbi:MAG: hypothetical protein QG597_360 [Actinomycetota bacterium]|nr:hypothetical protein [Actinomycetota bacterium]
MSQAGGGHIGDVGEVRAHAVVESQVHGSSWLAGRRFYALAAAACLLIAGVVSLLASSQPDGLERVAQDTGFASSAQDSATSRSPLADYQVAVGGSDSGPLGAAAAGVVGVALTAAVAFGLFAMVGRRRLGAGGGNDAGSEGAATSSPGT